MVGMRRALLALSAVSREAGSQHHFRVMYPPQLNAFCTANRKAVNASKNIINATPSSELLTERSQVLIGQGGDRHFEVADQTVACLTLYDESIKSNPKQVIAETAFDTITRPLRSIVLTIASI
jgi:hypothetical protein